MPNNTDIAKQRSARIAELIKVEGFDYATAKEMVADEFSFAASLADAPVTAPVAQAAVAIAPTTKTAKVAKVAKVVVPKSDLPETATFTFTLHEADSGSYGFINRQPTLTLPDGRIVKLTTMCGTVIGSKPK